MTAQVLAASLDRLAWKSLQRLALLALALAWTAPLHAQPQQQGLHVGSPQAVLNDPIVTRCRMLAARRLDPTLDSLTTAVDQAAIQFNIAPVFDAVAACRAALAAYPNEPKVIVAQYNASEALSVLALGLKFPESDEQALASWISSSAPPTNTASAPRPAVQRRSNGTPSVPMPEIQSQNANWHDCKAANSNSGLTPHRYSRKAPTPACPSCPAHVTADRPARS